MAVLSSDAPAGGNGGGGLAFDASDDDYISELAEFVAVPSVSRDASPDTMRAAADWPGPRA